MIGAFLANSRDRAFRLFSSCAAANRKDFVADEVLRMVWNKVYESKKRPVVGMYRLTLMHPF